MRGHGVAVDVYFRCFHGHESGIPRPPDAGQVRFGGVVQRWGPRFRVPDGVGRDWGVAEVIEVTLLLPICWRREQSVLDHSVQDPMKHVL